MVQLFRPLGSNACAPLLRRQEAATIELHFLIKTKRLKAPSSDRIDVWRTYAIPANRRSISYFLILGPMGSVH